MKFYNKGIHDMIESVKDKRIIFFGSGSWLQMIDHTELMKLKDHFVYVIDNYSMGAINLVGKELNVYRPEIIKNEKECIVILTSPIYMYEMYCQLVDMKLPDDIVCYAFPFVQMISNENNKNVDLLKSGSQQIPKIIHSFWFSGDKKPYSYQKCIDTWHDKLRDYKIIEWNMENYDGSKHMFTKSALEKKAWAYASDYARLDVLNKFGGIYLDMDVEVFRPFDNLLCNKAILSFSNNLCIDLAVMGAKKNNPLIKKLLELYDDIELPIERKEFVKSFQPILIRNTLAEYGIKMNGTTQCVKDVTVFSKEYFMPMDAILYRDYEKTEYTYCVHYDNFGWSFSKDNKKEKKKRDNNLLWDCVMVDS